MGVTPYKHSLARRASALDHDGQAGLKNANPRGGEGTDAAYQSDDAKGTRHWQAERRNVA